jgi:hypothetical protein
VIVSKAALTVTANNASRTYGAANPAFTVSYATFLNGDTAASLGGTLTCATTAAATSVPGSYPITCSGQTSTNYTITYVAGALTVTQAPLAITANDFSRTCGAANPAFTVAYAGFMNGETPAVLGGTLSCTTTAVAGSAPGAYPITCSGQTSANYAISYVAGTLTVTHAAPSVNAPIYPTDGVISGASAAAAGTTITIYRNGAPIGTTTVLANGTWSLSVAGLAGGDTITATAGAGVLTSPVSGAVTVAAQPGLLRTAQGGLRPATATFPRAPGDPSLSRSNLVVTLFAPSASFPQESTDYSDQTTPVVFYQLESNSGNTLRVSKDRLNGKLVINY